MDVNALVMDLLRQTVQEGNVVEGSDQIDLDTINPEHTVLIQLAFHVDITESGERVPHSDGLRVEVLALEMLGGDSPEQFPEGTVKGSG